MNDIKNKIKQLKDQLEKAYTSFEIEFWTQLNDIFEKYPKLEAIEISINNHEYCDGGPTYFDVGYEDMRLTIDGDEVLYDDEDDTEHKELLSQVYKLFNDTSVIHEKMFGEEYGELTITKKTVKNKLK